MGRLRATDVAAFADFVVGWDGMTEARLFGPAQGSADVAVPFGAELWRTVAEDHSDWLVTIANAVAEQTQKFLTEREAAAKN